jgi:hypothetical protein
MQICYTLNFMPAVLLTSKLCPKDMESTTYALLAGFQNFGQQVARTIGVALMAAFDIRTEPPCQWEGLAEMTALAHIVLPLVLVPLTFVLIPEASITDNLLEGDTEAERTAADHGKGADVDDDGGVLLRDRCDEAGEQGPSTDAECASAAGAMTAAAVDTNVSQHDSSIDTRS